MNFLNTFCSETAIAELDIAGGSIKSEVSTHKAEVSTQEAPAKEKETSTSDTAAKEEAAPASEKEKIPFMHDPLILVSTILMLIAGCVGVWFLKNNAILAVQGGLYFALLTYAAIMDGRTHKVFTLIPVAIALLAGLGIVADSSTTHLIYMALGLVIIPLPLLISNLVTRKKNRRGFGFGDVELMAASGLLLGVVHGYVALLVGLAISVIVRPILVLLGKKNVIKKPDKHQPFPLIPYLAIGCILGFLF